MSALSNDPHAPAERHDIGQIHLKGAAGGRLLAIADRSGGILASGRAGLREDAWSGGGLQYLRLARLPDDLHAIAGDGTGLLAY